MAERSGSVLQMNEELNVCQCLATLVRTPLTVCGMHVDNECFRPIPRGARWWASGRCADIRPTPIALLYSHGAVTHILFPADERGCRPRTSTRVPLAGGFVNQSQIPSHREQRQCTRGSEPHKLSAPVSPVVVLVHAQWYRYSRHTHTDVECMTRTTILTFFGTAGRLPPCA